MVSSTLIIRVKSEIEAPHKTLNVAARENCIEERNDELRNLDIRPAITAE